MEKNPLLWALAGLAVVLVAGSYYVFSVRAESAQPAPSEIQTVYGD